MRCVMCEVRGYVAYRVICYVMRVVTYNVMTYVLSYVLPYGTRCDAL